MASRKWILLFAVAVLYLGTGCVSLQEYQDVAAENEALRKDIRSSHQVIRKLEQEKLTLEKEKHTLAKQNESLKKQVGELKGLLKKTQEKYDEIFKKKLSSLVKVNLGKDFQVNPKTGGIVLEGDIFFQPGSATLRLRGKEMLRRLARKLSTPPYDSYVIEIAGHTDSDPVRRSKRKYKDNWWLSCARAYSVLKYMVSLGISPKRLYISGYSYYRPRSLKATPRGKKLNRRVEIVLHKKPAKNYKF